MFIISDRIKETTTSTGQGSIVLNGAFGAFQTFSNGIGDGNTTYYTIENNSRWEVVKVYIPPLLILSLEM
jgi:hypothetical protein